MDSSDDDVPIGARPVLKAAINMVDLEEGSDASGSPMPEWLSQHTPTQKALGSTDSNESDDVVDLSTPALAKREEPTKAEKGDSDRSKTPDEKMPAKLKGMAPCVSCSDVRRILPLSH
jgi:hypothetical protein